MARTNPYWYAPIRTVKKPDPTLDPTLQRPFDIREQQTSLPKNSEAERRKTYPLFSGLLKYFPDALAEVAHLSKVGNDQHNPGEPLHWDRAKSQDQLDALMRHLKDHAVGPARDTDGERHLTKVVWRALAELQLSIEAERNGEAQKEWAKAAEKSTRPVPPYDRADDPYYEH